MDALTTEELLEILAALFGVEGAHMRGTSAQSAARKVTQEALRRGEEPRGLLGTYLNAFVRGPAGLPRFTERAS